MKAVVFRGVGDLRVEDAPEPTIQHPTDAIVRLTSSAICGTDLHFARGTWLETAGSASAAPSAGKAEPTSTPP